MRHKITALEFRESVDRRLAAVQPDPFLASRIMASEEGAKTVRKKLPLSIVIAIALVIVATVAALAAGSIMGWKAFDEYFHDIPLPDSVWEVLETSDPVRCELEGVAFTVQETYVDGARTLASTKVEMADGSRALFVALGDHADYLASNGENGKALAESLGLDPMTHWTDAAKQLGVPLYAASADLSSGEMSDALYGTDGSMVFYSMGGPEDSGNAVILFQLMKIDPETGEESDIYELSVPVTLKKAR